MKPFLTDEQVDKIRYEIFREVYTIPNPEPLLRNMSNVVRVDRVERVLSMFKKSEVNFSLTLSDHDDYTISVKMDDDYSGIRLEMEDADFEQEMTACMSKKEFNEFFAYIQKVKHELDRGEK